MIKSVIIGSNGYLGRNYTKYLLSKGEDVRCYDISQETIGKGIFYQNLDITSCDQVNQLDLDVDYIYLLAGLTGTGQGFEQYNRYIDINEKGLLNILTRMTRMNSKAKIVFPSTRLVYKGKQGAALKEDDEKEPKTIYAVNKLACEQILSMYRKIFGVNYTVYRICVPYGHIVSGNESYGTIGFFIDNARKGKNITLFGDGSLRRSFTYIADICDRIYLSVRNEKTNGNVYNVGGENLSLLEVAEIISKKYNVYIDFMNWPDLSYKIESGDTIFDGGLLDSLTKTSYGMTLEKWVTI